MKTVLHDQVKIELCNQSAFNAYNAAVKNNLVEQGEPLDNPEAAIINKSKQSDRVDKFKDFRDIAKQAKSPREFIEKAREIKNVPADVANAYSDRYKMNGRSSMEDAAQAFMIETSFKENSKGMTPREIHKYLDKTAGTIRTYEAAIKNKKKKGYTSAQIRAFKKDMHHLKLNRSYLETLI